MILHRAARGLKRHQPVARSRISVILGLLTTRTRRTRSRNGDGLAADLLGVDDRGVIAAGKRADLVAVHGSPLEDNRVMEDVRFVMKLGKVYKRD